MVLRQVLPLSTRNVSENSISYLSKIGIYSPYDFSNVTLADFTTLPFIRDSDVIIGMAVFFWFVQFVGYYLLMMMFSVQFKKMPMSERRDLSVRFVAVVNAIISIRSCYLFITTIANHGFSFHSFHFQEMEGYHFGRLAIVGYFLWDLCICVYYRWGALWTAHALVSFIGTFGMACLPMSDHFGAYFSGVFEMSNGMIHVATLFRAVDIQQSLAKIFDYIFAVTFLFIRVIGGTYITGQWYYDMYVLYTQPNDTSLHIYNRIIAPLTNSTNGWVGEPPLLIDTWNPTALDNMQLCPPLIFIIIMGFLLSVVMGLQYVWFVAIVRIGLGIAPNDGGGSPTSKLKEKSYKQNGPKSEMTNSNIIAPVVSNHAPSESCRTMKKRLSITRKSLKED